MREDWQLLAVLGVMSLLVVDMLIMENGSIIVRIVRVLVEIVERIG
jgi:hypothetical protein